MLKLTDNITEMFRNVAADTAERAKMQLHYEHGHILEVIATLQNMTKSPKTSALKYPILLLMEPFEEKMFPKSNIASQCDFHIVIATMTKQKYNSEEREQHTFIPELYPLYDAFIDAVCQSGYFVENRKEYLKPTRICQKYWGKSGLYGNQGNVFNDFVDAIEIKNLLLNIKYKKNNCYGQNQ